MGCRSESGGGCDRRVLAETKILLNKLAGKEQNYGIDAERVRQIEHEAIGKLQDPQKASELKKLINSPPLRRFVQRPLAKTSRGFRHL